jgi:carbon-monoxide dehydrogenase large subunit
VVDALACAGQGRAAEKLQMPLTGEVVWRGLRGDYGPALSIPG